MYSSRERQAKSLDFVYSSQEGLVKSSDLLVMVEVCEAKTSITMNRLATLTH